jgi:cytochrome c oxidase cbb3-type subunit 1
MSARAERTGADAASRWPILLLLLSGILWLLLAGLLSLLAAAQIHDPAFMAHCPVFTYGRTAAMAETAFVYGWLANAGLAMAVWVLGRLAGEPLRAQNWSLAGCAFWNTGVAIALIGIGAGDGTGFALLGLPAYVQLILLFSYGAVAIGGILAWSGRLRRVPFASHWYGAAALFTFPWILSVAHVMLFRAPVRGVMQAVVAGWFAQSAWWLWLAPLCLSAAYYVVPKLSGRTLGSYEFATLGFWCALFVGGLTAGRGLTGGPVPVWIQAVAVVAGGLMVFHVLIVLLNLRGAFGAPGASAKFLAFGMAAYFLTACANAVTSFIGVSRQVQFTFMADAQAQLALYGAASMILFGALYYALPRITGRAWLSAGLIRAHLGLSAVGILLLVVCLAAAGASQGRLLLDASKPFTEITRTVRPWLIGACAAQAILLLGNIILAVNFYGSACEILKLTPEADFEPAAGSQPS